MGWGPVFFLRFYRCSEAELSQQSEPILARVQGLPGALEARAFLIVKYSFSHFLWDFLFKIFNNICVGILQNFSFQNPAHLDKCIFLLLL